MANINHQRKEATQPLETLCVTYSFQYLDARGDALRGNTRDFGTWEGTQSSVCRRLCSSAHSITHEPDGPYPVTESLRGTSNQVNFPPQSSSPYCPPLTGAALEEEKSASSGMTRHTSDMIRCVTAFIHLSTGNALCIQFVATDLLQRSLANQKTSCSTHKEHKPKDFPLNPLKDQVSYLVSSVAM